MRTIELKNVLARLTKKPAGTIADRISVLQEAGLITKGGRGRYGGVDLTERDVTSAALSVIMDLPRRADIGEEVRRLRALPLSGNLAAWIGAGSGRDVTDRAVQEFLAPLAIASTQTFGESLDSLIHDFRTGVYGDWVTPACLRGAQPQLCFEVKSDDAMATILVDHDSVMQSVALFYANGPIKARSAVSRNVRVSYEFFIEIAQAMGPAS